MKIVKEVDMFDWLRHGCCEGASNWISHLSDDEVRQLATLLEELYDGTVYESDINDFLWFESDVWLPWLGYESTDDLLDKPIGGEY